MTSKFRARFLWNRAQGKWAAALCALSLVATACTAGQSVSSGAPSASPGGPSAGPGKVIVADTGGTHAAADWAAYFAPFQAKTGIQVQLIVGPDDPLAAVQAQVASGNIQWDLVICRYDNTLQDPSAWEPTDTSIVHSNDLIYPDQIGKLYVVNEITGFPVLAYSTTAFPTQGPASWADYFDVKKFPGPRGMMNIGLTSALRVPVTALLADGVAPANLFPLDLNRAYAKLDKLKPDIRVFWTTFAQSQDILRQGEVVMTPMADGRALQLLYGGSKVGVSWNGFVQGSGTWCVPKGAPNKVNAFKVLQYMLENPQQQAVQTSLTFYSPPTKAGAAAAKGLGVTDFASLHVAEASIKDNDPVVSAYTKENAQMLLARWNAWVGK